jgi:hypothetical protein
MGAASIAAAKRCGAMRSMRCLPLLAVIALPGCDGSGAWLRGQGAGTAYAAPLASDTSVLTIRRVWSAAPNNGLFIDIDYVSIMPAGTGVATTDWKTGDPGIFDLASREFRRFRFNDEPHDTGLAVQTVASPDGSQIMFLWHDLRADRWEGRVLDVATGESRMVMALDSGESVWPLVWTPNADSVFTLISRRQHRREDQIVLIPVAGGTRRLVHTIPWAWPRRVSVSPDGKWILYDHELSRDQQNRSDIYVIDVQGGGARPVVEHPAVDLLVGWLPGTDIVLFSSDRSGTTDLWSVRIADGRATAEPRLVRSGFFRSDVVGFADRALFYRVRTGAYGQAFVNVDPHSGALLGSASPPLEDLFSPPRAQAWSPDGQRLVVPSWPHALTLHSMETGDSRKFWLDGGVRALMAQWAPDGSSIILRVAGEGVVPTGPHHFLRLNLATGTTTRLFAADDPEEQSTNWGFLATPDGRSILLRQQRILDDGRTGMALVLRSLGDGSERELYHTAGFIPEFSISVDGTRLAFVQQVWENSDSLFVMRMDGPRPLQYVASWRYDAVSLLGWLPAGNALLAARLTEDGTAEEILRIEIDGSITVVGMSPFRPMRGGPAQGYNRSRLALSPAGNRLTHHVSEAGEELWRMDGLHELFARDANGRR